MPFQALIDGYNETQMTNANHTCYLCALITMSQWLS